MQANPFYCRKAFWMSARGVLLAVSAVVAHYAGLHGVDVVLMGAAAVCGNLGSVIAAGEGPAQGDSGNAGA